MLDPRGDPTDVSAAAQGNEQCDLIEIELPQLGQGLLGAALFSLILSFNETIRTSLVQRDAIGLDSGRYGDSGVETDLRRGELRYVLLE